MFLQGVEEHERLRLTGHEQGHGTKIEMKPAAVKQFYKLLFIQCHRKTIKTDQILKKSV